MAESFVSSDGTTTAILDLTRVDLSLCAASGDSFGNLSLFEALQLKSSIEKTLRESPNSWNDFNDLSLSSNRPLYHPTLGHKEDSRRVQQIVNEYLINVSQTALETFHKTRNHQKRLQEQLSRLSFSSQLSNIAEQEKDLYLSDSDEEEQASDASSAMSEGEQEESPSRSGKSLGKDLRSFYEKMVQSDNVIELRLEDKLPAKSVCKLNSNSLSSSVGNRKEYVHRLLKTQVRLLKAIY